MPRLCSSSAALHGVRTVLPLLLVLVMGGPRSAPLTAIVPERITIVSTAVTLDPGDLSRVRVGRMTLLGGWALSSTSAQFGGWSGLHVENDHVIALGDFGSILRFRLTRFGRALGARIDPLPPGCGDYGDRDDRDSESLTPTPATLGSGWLIGFESHNRICRIAADFTGGRAYAPQQMSRWRRVGGAEAMVALRDGRVLVFSEQIPAGRKQRSLLVFSGDPTVSATPVEDYDYRPPPGYEPTDAAELPDGRVIVLHRRFSVFSLFTTVVTVIDPAALDKNRSVAGEPVARFAPPVVSDNYEGLAVTEEAGQPIVWMMSDDNFMTWQKTYLLKFKIDLPPGGSRRAP